MTEPALDDAQVRSLLAIAFLAGFADGTMDGRERAHLRGLARSLGGGGPAYVERLSVVLPPRLDEAVAVLDSPTIRQRAFELAVVICNADGVRSDEEAGFLAQLGRALDLPEVEARAIDAAASAIAAAADAPVASLAPRPLPGGVRPDAATVDAAIVDAATTCGALERLPQSLASLAVFPLQVRLVRRIGLACGDDDGAARARAFASALGVGHAGPFLERYGRRLRGAAGGPAEHGPAAADRDAYAATWALGQMARPYYRAGGAQDAARLKSAFAPLVARGRELASQRSGPIDARARAIDARDLPGIVLAA